MKAILVLILVITFAGCAGVEQTRTPLRKLDFGFVAQLPYGVASKDDAARILGQPDRIIPLKRELSETETWLYGDAKSDQTFDRLGLLVHKKTGIVQSATWIIRPGDPLSKKDSALAWFKGIDFTSAPEGQVAHDYYSNDLIYSNSQRGISMLVDSLKQTVKSISFSAPKTRSLAEKQEPTTLRTK